MKFEYKFGPKSDFDYSRNKGYFVKDKTSGNIYAAFITGWTEGAEVIYFKDKDPYNFGEYHRATHSTIRHLIDCYTIVSEINRISFHEVE